jgi:hypothetical protein
MILAAMMAHRARRAEAAGAVGVGTGTQDGTPTLPYGRAFIVQFTSETETARGRVAGRVEHLKTGGRSWFTSIDGLLASMSELLGEPPPDPRARRRDATKRSGSRPARRGAKTRRAR